MSTITTSSTLRELSDQELALCQRVETLDNNHAQWQLNLRVIGAEYTYVQRTYARLATDAADAGTRLEALKRLVFLSWYGNELVEPDFISGLSYPEATVVQDSYALLDAYLTSTPPDLELRWMLAFYSSWEEFIPAFTDPNLPALTAFVAGVDHTVLHVPKGQLPPGAMAHRGQMGQYWQIMGAERGR